MSKRDLEQALHAFRKQQLQLSLLCEKRELEIELDGLSPDQKVGRGYFFRLEIDQEIEATERELKKLNTQIRRLERSIPRDPEAERSWRDYAGQQHEHMIERKDRVIDAGRNMRDKVRDALPQRGNPHRTEAERLQEQIDQTTRTYFPDIYKKQQQDLKARERAAEQRERPWREGARELERKERKAERERLRDAKSAEPELSDDGRQEQLRRRLRFVDNRLQGL